WAADRVRVVGAQDRRVLPVAGLQRGGDHVFGRLVHERRAGIFRGGAARPRRGELLVGAGPSKIAVHDPMTAPMASPIAGAWGESNDQDGASMTPSSVMNSCTAIVPTVTISFTSRGSDTKSRC